MSLYSFTSINREIFLLPLIEIYLLLRVNQETYILEKHTMFCYADLFSSLVIMQFISVTFNAAILCIPLSRIHIFCKHVYKYESVVRRTRACLI